MAVAASVKMEERAYAGSRSAELPKVRIFLEPRGTEETCCCVISFDVCGGQTALINLTSSSATNSV